jgi:hypothetical protein
MAESSHAHPARVTCLHFTQVEVSAANISRVGGDPHNRREAGVTVDRNKLRVRYIQRYRATHGGVAARTHASVPAHPEAEATP